MRKFTWLLVAVPFAGLTLAQEGDVSIPEFSQWFASPHTLALVVVGLVSLVRKHLLTKLDGLAVPVVALVLAIALSFVGNQAGYLSGNWVMFGLQAGLEAVLAVSGFRTLISSLSKPQGSGSSASADGGDTPPPAKVSPRDKAR